MLRSTALLPILLTALACSDASSPGADATPAARLSADRIQGLLTDLSGESVERLKAVRDLRDSGAECKTSLPEEIDFAPDIYTAIERATAQDKPILMTSVVTKGGRKQADCDV